MNNKRQTIWLVSMLSLMVILSAYYLFTEDLTPSQTASGKQEQSGYTASPDGASGVEITEADPPGEHPNSPGAAGSPDPAKTGESEGAAGGTEGTETKSGDKDASGAISPEDEAVLQGMANLGGSQMIAELQRLRAEQFASESERLSTIMADTKNTTQEEASSAAEELTRLEELDSRMTRLEEKLLQDYDNAVVTENNANFKVIVQAGKMEKKQALQILDLAAKELNVPHDRLSVQYVP